jgi:hypothetical protein
MFLLRTLATALAWFGRQGTRAIATLVFIGVAAPPLGAVLKPYVAEAIFVLLVLAFLRVEPAILQDHLRRPKLAIVTTLWTMCAVPAAFGAVCLGIGLDGIAPDLFLGLMLQAVASPMMAAPAFAALMGLDATLVLVALVLSTASMPIVAPMFAYAFIGPALALSPLTLGLKLFGILAGAAVTAAVVIRLAGRPAIARRRDALDGCNVVVLFVFVASVTENVAAGFIDQPVRMIGLMLVAFATVLAVLVFTALVFAHAGKARALAIGLMASQRNMGLMVAAAGRELPEMVWIYFALCQFPIYLLPQLLKPVARSVAPARPWAAAPPAQRGVN